MILSLAVVIKNKVVEIGELAWSSDCCQKILPLREPDLKEKKNCYRAWIISPDKRDIFMGHADRMLDSFASNKENLFGFFVMAGIDNRWADNTDCVWILVYSSGSVLKIGDSIIV